jgi:hypothetical protein
MDSKTLSSVLNSSALRGTTKMQGASFEAITGRLGIGAIAFLGLFLIVDRMQVGVFELIQIYGKSTAWGIVGVVPTVVVTYIIGVFALGIAELALSRVNGFSSPHAKELVAISRSGSPLLDRLYAENLRNHELLKGAFVSFLLLATGCIDELPNQTSRPNISSWPTG